MKIWVRIALIAALAIVLWYLVINLTQSMTAGDAAPAPTTSPQAQ